MRRYHCAIEPAKLVAIDTHVHVEKDAHGHHALPGEVLDAAAKYFKAPTERLTIDETAQHYRERRMAAVVFTVDATTAMGHEPNSITEISVGAARNNDVLIPFGSVDPHGAYPAEEVSQQVEELGVRGFKFHPSVQNFDPSDTQFFPIYEAIARYRLPAIFHTGQTGIGARLRGGFGINLRLSNPMLLDIVAATFPDMDLIMAHPSVPWQEEAIAVATHKANVHIDLSGWSPKYFPPALVRQTNTLLQDKVLFATDFPLFTPERLMRDFENLDIKDEVRPKVLKINAARLLGLEGVERAA